MKFSEIPQFTRVNNWEVEYGMIEFVEHIKKEIEEGLVLNPDFQRGHVWSEEQQTAFIEFVLMGGMPGVIYLNAPSWPSVYDDGNYVCVDGLQRITAITKFIDNEIKAFGHYCNEFEDKMHRTDYTIRLNVNNLKTRKEVLKWYIEINSGGTPHSKEEIERVKALLAEA